MFRRRTVSASGQLPSLSLDDLSPESVLRISYELLLHRAPDPIGIATHLGPLSSGDRSSKDLVEWITSSAEFAGVNRRTELGPSIQESRSLFVRSLPKAARILDLGGTALNVPEGAFIGSLRYPYEFETLVIVDLPAADRNQIYRDGANNDVVRSPQGPVTYRYHSMTNLDGLAENSFDLAYLGQSIEHVEFADADTVLQELRRVLCPTGYLALDTPNSRLTRLQQPTFIDPDHKYEYSHQEMLLKLADAGFEIIEQKGLNYGGRSVQSGEFLIHEVAGNSGVFADIEACYILAYLCRPA